MYTIQDIIRQELLGEEVSSPDNKKGILFLDIDDTLLTAQNIFIHRTKDHPKGAAKLTPEQYAGETVTPETKAFYDYKEFRDPAIVLKSIKSGIPIVNNLKMMDAHIKNDWKIGLLTARGLEDVIFKAVKSFLKFKDTDGKLKPIGNHLQRQYVHAINDGIKGYPGKTDFEKKAKVLQKYRSDGWVVKFLDDDDKNIKAVRGLKDKKIHAVKAHEQSKGDK